MACPVVLVLEGTETCCGAGGPLNAQGIDSMSLHMVAGQQLCQGGPPCLRWIPEGRMISHAPGK
jgi:hypothetical protein